MFIRGCRRCMLAHSLVLQCRSAFLFASCEMLRDITRGTKVTRCRIIVVKCFLSFFFLFFFFFFVLFVCVSILQSSWMITLSVANVGSDFYVCYYFFFFFFSYYCAPRSFEDRSMSPGFFYFNASCVFSRTMEFEIWRNEYCDNLSNIFSLIWRRALKSCERGLDKRLRL